jgi:hypothetical protein
LPTVAGLIDSAAALRGLASDSGGQLTEKSLPHHRVGKFIRRTQSAARSTDMNAILIPLLAIEERCRLRICCMLSPACDYRA